jgi:hypothetical protein
VKHAAADAARWMLGAFESGGGYLAQDDAALEIQRRFGDEFTYDNQNGNLAIRRDVLDEFRSLTADTVVWLRTERAWRRREPGDPAGRMAE